MSSPPPDPGRLILWLLAVILFVVLVALLLSVLDVHTQPLSGEGILIVCVIGLVCSLLLLLLSSL